VERWRAACDGALVLVERSSQADLELPPAWYANPTLGVAILRNSYTHPRDHLIDFHLQRGRRERAVQMAEDIAASVADFNALDARFPAGALAYRGIGLALSGRPEAAMDALREAVTLRPALGPMFRDEGKLSSLHGRPDFEELTSAKPPG